jgi:DNA-binding transcriptional ArsR family regulator
MAQLKDPSQLRVLASGVRQELVDTLEALGGEASVREIAAHLGRPMDGLYYHLKHLLAAGLISLSETSGTGRGERRYRMAAASGERLRLNYASAQGDGGEVLTEVVQGLLRLAESDFKAALANPDTVRDGPARELWAARSKGWLDPTDLAEANQLLNRVCDLLRRGPRGPQDKLYALSFVFAAQTVRGLRR